MAVVVMAVMTMTVTVGLRRGRKGAAQDESPDDSDAQYDAFHDRQPFLTGTTWRVEVARRCEPRFLQKAPAVPAFGCSLATVVCTST
jgi:hypothetical protein